MNTKELINAGINVSDLMQRIMNNEKLLKLILGKFLEDTTYDWLVAAASSRDREALEHSSHTLKGICGNLSHTVLFDIFRDQVMMIRAGEIEGALALMPKITEEYENAKHHIKLWLDENK